MSMDTSPSTEIDELKNLCGDLGLDQKHENQEGLIPRETQRIFKLIRTKLQQIPIKGSKIFHSNRLYRRKSACGDQMTDKARSK